MSKVKHGQEVFTVEPDGCLNGIYTNEHTKGMWYNEIATRKNNTKNEHDDIIGEYHSAWFEGGGVLHKADLKISFPKNKSKAKRLTFEWTKKGKRQFIGNGRQMGNKLFLNYKSA